MDENWKREMFLNRQFEANALNVDGVGLDSTVDDIDYFDIVDVFVDKKVFDHLRFTDRIELLKQGNGWIHTAKGASFGIKKGKVVQVKLSTRYLQENKLCRKDFIEIFGEPDKELVDDISYSVVDYNIDATILVYKKKHLYAFFEPNNDSLKELHFGELDEKIYTEKK